MGYAHGIKWDEEKIIKNIYKVMDALNVERMPSNSEIKLVTGNSALSNKISKTGGFYYWADRLNLTIKRSETSFGVNYEKKIKTKLENMGFKVEKMGVKHPYDLLVNDNIKIDVKVARPFDFRDNTIMHTFNLEKRNPTCDLYIAIALTSSQEVERIFMIPSKHLKLTQLSVGKKSLYDKYIDRWDYISIYDNFYQNVL